MSAKLTDVPWNFIIVSRQMFGMVNHIRPESLTSLRVVSYLLSTNHPIHLCCLIWPSDGPYRTIKKLTKFSTHRNGTKEQTLPQVESRWNVVAHGDTQEGRRRGNWRMECLATTLHTTSVHGVSSITTADAHTWAASSRLNWRPRQFKWTRPFRRKTKYGFYACAITFQTQSTSDQCSVKLGLSHCGRYMGWEFWKIGFWRRYLGLRGTR